MTTLIGISTILAALAPHSEATAVTTCDSVASHFESNRPKRYVDADRVARWNVDIGSRFANLKGLKDGWAGVGSKQPCKRTVFKAHRVLGLALEGQRNPVLPSVVPAANGGLQLEWHGAEYDFEIYFGPDDSVTAILEDLNSGLETEKEGNAAIDLLFGSIARVAQSGGDARVTALSSQGPDLEFAA